MTKNRRTFLQGAGVSLAALATGGSSAFAAGADRQISQWQIAGRRLSHRLDALQAGQQLRCGRDGHASSSSSIAARSPAWPGRRMPAAGKACHAAEWNAGAEALASVKGDTALVLGVQTEGFNVANSQAYAKKAKSLNADGIISLVPPNANDADRIAYFKALADASGLPIMVQAVGDVSVDQLVALAAAVPSIVAVKDEAGDPLERAPDLLKKTGGKLEDFSGGGGMHLLRRAGTGFPGHLSLYRPGRCAAGLLQCLSCRQEARGLRHLRPLPGFQLPAARQRICDEGARRVRGRRDHAHQSGRAGRPPAAPAAA